MDISDFIPLITTTISALGGVVGAGLAVKKGNRESEIKNAIREQRQGDMLDRIEEKIEKLDKKVEEHNGYAVKFGEVAKGMAVMSKDIENIKERLK